MRLDIIMIYKRINDLIDIYPCSILQIKTNINQGHYKILLIDNV